MSDFEILGIDWATGEDYSAIVLPPEMEHLRSFYERVGSVVLIAEPMPTESN